MTPMVPQALSVTGMGAAHADGHLGKVEIDVPRARLQVSDGKTIKWRSSALRAYQRRTLAEAAEQQGHHRRAGHDAHRVGRDQHAGGGNVNLHAVGDHGQQAHGGELGRADGERASGQGEQGGRGVG